jgi:hypothetical protein
MGPDRVPPTAKKSPRFSRAALIASMWCGLTYPAAASAEAVVANHSTIDSQDTVVPQPWLDRARTLRVYFGHQSVGDNILAGLGTLSRQKPDRYGTILQRQPGRLSLSRLLQSEASNPVRQGGIEHFLVGRNGDPEGKLKDFAQRMSDRGNLVDVAMMKFCFVDFPVPASDPAHLFADYRDSMERLQKDYPKVRVVWWTAPLTRSDNAQRNEYNRLVRDYAAAHSKILYDIADIESHDPQGHETIDPSGPVLYAGYTQDGGHLTAEGQLRAARAWWWLSARIAGWAGPERDKAARNEISATPPGQ